jgi:hypothetical protein
MNTEMPWSVFKTMGKFHYIVRNASVVLICSLENAFPSINSTRPRILTARVMTERTSGITYR